MIDPVQVLWSPAGVSLASLGDRALVDVTDGDTPNIRMPIRMLSVDTPEVTAQTADRAAAVDREFVQLAEWIDQGRAPISPGLAAHLLPKLATGKAGTLQFEQGQAASAFAKQNIDTRLTRPDGSRRNLFIRVTDTLFDTHGRLLAYVAPTTARGSARPCPGPSGRRSTSTSSLTAGLLRSCSTHRFPGSWTCPCSSPQPRAPAPKRRASGRTSRHCWPTTTGR